MTYVEYRGQLRHHRDTQPEEQPKTESGHQGGLTGASERAGVPGQLISSQGLFLYQRPHPPPALSEEASTNPSFMATLLRSLLAFDHWASNQLGVCTREDSPWACGRPLMKIIEFSGHGVPWLAATLCGLYVNRSPAGRELLINMLFALVLDLISVGLLKGLVKRKRPADNKMDMFATVSVDQYSFPSGHATRAAMVSRFVLHHLTLPAPLQVLVVFWAPVVGLSRIMLGRHNVTDVIFGLAMGYVQYSVVEYFWLSPVTAPALFAAWGESKCLSRNL
ncbi:PREDICTED: presqualene diphosphate phosphatase-like [Gekko japonicus]|uniref:Polyisoprenoid diphosphate/phosphate phosphohydrolase PLPP6 n=1 Tax=Gekko japonicus TaxID=146911 RepID=A0ABM1KBL7_GEKJA|nr:PREDICTED: presqualene diphosphate phosphatase-like [Gekko japonicus]